jgi:hypothetical protein
MNIHLLAFLITIGFLGVSGIIVLSCMSEIGFFILLGLLSFCIIVGGSYAIAYVLSHDPPKSP